MFQRWYFQDEACKFSPLVISTDNLFVAEVPKQPPHVKRSRRVSLVFRSASSQPSPLPVFLESDTVFQVPFCLAFFEAQKGSQVRRPSCLLRCVNKRVSSATVPSAWVIPPGRWQCGETRSPAREAPGGFEALKCGTSWVSARFR